MPFSRVEYFFCDGDIDRSIDGDSGDRSRREHGSVAENNEIKKNEKREKKRKEREYLVNLRRSEEIRSGSAIYSKINGLNEQCTNQAYWTP